MQIDPSNLNTSHGLMVKLAAGARRVLDVGCAEGDLARVLTERGAVVSGVEGDPAAAEVARPTLDRLLIGDLDRVDLLAEFGAGSFDAVILGDVLEHLVNPGGVLRQARDLLSEDGRVIISLPNVAHAAVRLSLLLGRWRYRELGLLDRTHLRFFTRETLEELLGDAGLRPVEREQTTAGPFDTELGLRADEVAPDVVAQVLADPDAHVYQFVWSAGRADRTSRLADLLTENAALAERLRQAEATAAQLEPRLRDAEAALQDAAAWRSWAAERLRRADEERTELSRWRGRAVAAETALEHARATVAAVHGSTSWRVSAPVRAVAPVKTLVSAGIEQRAWRADRRQALWRSVRLRGVRGAFRAAVAATGGDDGYRAWIARNGTLTGADVAAIGRHIATWADPPLISVVMPTYDSSPEHLAEAIRSVQDQLYSHWQLIVVDDASPTKTPLTAVAELAGGDPRVITVQRSVNGGIAQATNDGIDRADGALVAFLDHDDVLAPHALYLLAAELVADPDLALIYTDEDKLDAAGLRYGPAFKPDLNLDLLHAVNYVNHLTAVRTDLLRELHGLRTGYDGAQDHDLVLRAVDRAGAARVRHVPHVAYHWRAHVGSQTFSSGQLDRATDASRRAVRELLHGRGHAVQVEPAPHLAMWNRVVWPLPQPAPSVTIVIPTRDRVDLLRRAVEGVLEQTDYPALQLLIADNESASPRTAEYLAQIQAHPQVQVLPVPGPFNFSAINNAAVAASDTELVLLLNNDVLVREPGWLREMVSHIVRPDVGVVGAKLYYGDGRVQHAGAILGIGGVAGHSHKHLPGGEVGYGGRLILTQEMSAVTGACLLTRRALWDELGGLDEAEFAIAFNDIDYCLRVRAAGYRVVWTPYAELDHLESASRGLEDNPDKVDRFEREHARMLKRWGPVLSADPFYNPNLTVHAEDFSLADPPRAPRPWQDYLDVPAAEA